MKIRMRTYTRVHSYIVWLLQGGGHRPTNLAKGVDTRQATALEKGATARLVKYIADQLYLIC